ncbi:MAG: RNA pseudouridine synthase, partial [Candidatus Omnitrophota bacterium]
MKEYRLEVLPENEGKRLDICIMDFSQKNNLGFSRTFVQKFIKNGSVELEELLPGGKKVSLKPHYKLKSGQRLRIHIEGKKELSLAAENIPLEVVYEDNDLAVINKPSGLVVHPAPGNLKHTLVNALLYRFNELSDINPAKPGIVHRLDKETSGLIVIAKNNYAHLRLSRQFAKHSIQRIYVALVKGKMEFQEHVIELPIGRHPYKRKNMSVGFNESAKYAKTYYRTLKRTPAFSVLELKPYTGRTHQLRVHLAY